MVSVSLPTHTGTELDGYLNQLIGQGLKPEDLASDMACRAAKEGAADAFREADASCEILSVVAAV